MTFEGMLTELGLFDIKKKESASSLLTPTAWRKDIGKVELDSSWTCTEKGQEVSECTQVAV